MGRLPTAVLEQKVIGGQVKQGVLYHAALQSAYGFGYAFKQQAGTRYKIAKLTWAFYLDKTSVKSRATGIMLASTATQSKNIIRIRLSVTNVAFSDEEIESQYWL